MVDANHHARIAGFGLAWDQEVLDETDDTADGSMSWTAPEILKGQVPSSDNADVFSFAMVIVEVCLR